MKLTKLTCNACRETVELEHEPYASNPPKVGWYHVVVSQLRPPPPRERDPMEDAVKSLRDLVVDMPPEAKKFADAMSENMRATQAQYQQYEPPLMPSSQGADLCPTCGPKVLAGVMPHVTSEHPSHMLVGAR